MLMMHAPKGTGDWNVAEWTPDELKAHIAFMMTLNADLSASGELAGAEGLAPPAGPFTETKEFLAGYWIVNVPSVERAYAIAARASSAPGRGGAPLNMAIEVREVMGAPPA
jgi:hypothetical protein